MTELVLFDHGNFKLAVAYSDPASALASYSLLPATIDAAISYLSQYVRFAGTIDIEVRVSGTSTGRFAGGPTDIYSSGNDAQGRRLVELSLIEESRTGVDRNPGTADITIYVDSGLEYLKSLWFDPAIAAGLGSNPPNGKIDAFSVVLHEILHGMGVVGYRDYETGTVTGNYVTPYDTLVKVSAGSATFNGAAVIALLGEPLELRLGGSQGIYHFGEGHNPEDSDQPWVEADNLNGYHFYLGERYTLGRLDLAVLSDIGWTIRPNALIDVTNRWDDRVENLYLVGQGPADVLTGSDQQDRIEGRGGNDTIAAHAGDDLLWGNGGDDRIDGGNGLDIAYFDGALADYEIIRDGDLIRVADRRSGAPDGIDLVSDVEILRFIDRDLATAGLASSSVPVSRAGAVGVLAGIAARIAQPGGSVADLSAPGHGTVLANADGSVTYMPTAGFTGEDSFTITARDAAGTVSINRVTVAVTALAAADDWRLFTPDGFMGVIGGSGTVFGTAGFQHIIVADEPGMVVFDPSFNRGGDFIRLSGAASDWRAVRSGSSVLFNDGDTTVAVPLGSEGVVVTFADGPRLLRFDTASMSAVIGDKTIGTELATFGSPGLAMQDPPGTSAGATARLYLASGSNATVGGNISVIGSTDHEEVKLASGSARFDPSFNVGNDILHFDQPASAFSAVRSGSNVLFDSDTTDAIVPIGTGGILLDFAGQSGILMFDAALGQVRIGSLVIGSEPVALIYFG